MDTSKAVNKALIDMTVTINILRTGDFGDGITIF